MKRFAIAKWQGGGKEGKGFLTTQSSALNNIQYSYSTRFEEQRGTNPEELIAAAHAGCFSMKLTFLLGAAGFTPNIIDTRCDVTFENGEIKESHLTVKAKVSGITTEKFQEVAMDAKANCPVSNVLNCVVSHEAILDS